MRTAVISELKITSDKVTAVDISREMGKRWKANMDLRERYVTLHEQNLVKFNKESVGLEEIPSH